MGAGEWLIVIAVGVGVTILVYALQQGYNQKEADRTGAAVARAMKASDASDPADPHEILRRRFASGEIDEAEYKARLSILDS